MGLAECSLCNKKGRTNWLFGRRDLLCYNDLHKILEDQASHWHCRSTIWWNRDRGSNGVANSRSGRITKGCTRSTHSGGCEVVRLSFVPGEPRRYPAFGRLMASDISKPA